MLALENNSLVRVQETQIESSKFALLGAHAPFDPVITTFYNVNSSSSAPFSQLQGTGASSTFISTTQIAQFTYSETFATGTNIQAGLGSNNNYTNNSFYLSTRTSLHFSIFRSLSRCSGMDGGLRIELRW